MWEKGFYLAYIFSYQSLSFREVRAGTQAGANAKNMEQIWLLSCSSWFLQFTYTTQDQLKEEKPPTVGWGFTHDSTIKLGPVTGHQLQSCKPSFRCSVH